MATLSPTRGSFLPRIFLPASADQFTPPTALERTKLHLSNLLSSKRFRLLGVTALVLLGLIVLTPQDRFDAFSTTWDYDGLVQGAHEHNHADAAGTPGSPGVNGEALEVSWSDFAYTQYVTNSEYLCNSLMLFETLQRLGSKADRLMMYPGTMKLDGNPNNRDGKLLLKARDEYGVKLQAVEVQHRDQAPTWADSYTKLLAFNQTQYKRVLNVDSDSTILKHMDELFLTPMTTLAVPRAYWLEEKPSYLSSQLLLIQPSAHEFERIKKAIDTAATNDFDMEIINNLYKDQCMILPHRKYDLLTGEFRKKDSEHQAYLGNKWEKWDADKVLAEASFLHFSDWPMPKPWIGASAKVKGEAIPKCEGGSQNCKEKVAWEGFYEDFAKRRKEVCTMETAFGKRSLEKKWWEFDPNAS